MEASRTGTSSETWLQRARAMGPEPTVTALEAAATVESAWDPYEVWLHRIRRPQQGRDGTAK